MLVAEYYTQVPAYHKAYLLGRKRFPLQLSRRGPLNKSDTLWNNVVCHSSPPLYEQPKPKPQWISEATLKLIDTRASLGCNRNHDQATARRLTRVIDNGCKADRIR